LLEQAIAAVSGTQAGIAIELQSLKTIGMAEPFPP
jgi:hypothetical protein